MVYCPAGRKMDVLFSGGETIRLAPDWNLRVWHVPGHSAGHLAIYDEKNHAAFTSDAVQSNGYPTIDGKMAFGPTYYTVDAYLATARFLEDQPIEHMFSGHWPDLHGAEINHFLKATREFVLRADELLMTNYLRTQAQGATLNRSSTTEPAARLLAAGDGELPAVRALRSRGPYGAERHAARGNGDGPSFTGWP